MTHWTADAIIQVVFIILYAILLVPNAFNVVKHGFTREAAYILLIVVSILKIVGNSLLVVYETGDSNSISLYIWGLIVSQLGLLGLLIAGISFIRKWIHIYERDDPRLSKYLLPTRLIHLFIIAGVICAIISGVWTDPTSPNIQQGYNLRRASAIIFLVAILLILGLALFMMSKSRTHEQRYNLVIVQDIIVMPILLFRIIYVTVQAFLNNPSNPNHNTFVYLGLLLIPDFISLLIYTIFGFLTERTPQAAPLDGGKVESGLTPQGRQSSTFSDQNGTGQHYPAGSSQPGFAQHSMRERKQRRFRGPIHMLIDAFRGE